MGADEHLPPTCVRKHCSSSTWRCTCCHTYAWVAGVDGVAGSEGAGARMRAMSAPSAWCALLAIW